MKRIVIVNIYILIQWFSIINAHSQTNSSVIDWDLSIRERFEAWDGMNAKNYGDPTGVGKLNDKMLLQRIIAGMSYRPTKNLTLTAHIQDSRAFGWSLRNSLNPDVFKIKAKNAPSPFYIMNPNEEFFEIHDFFLEYKELFKYVTFYAGRQKISYGDNRIFGPGEWGNTGRWTWDAVKISLKKGPNFIDIFGGGTKIHDPEKISLPFTQTEFWGGGIYAHYEGPKTTAIEPFYALKTQGSADFINTQEISRHWVGMRIVNNNIHHWVADFTLAKEFGRESQKTIRAFGLLAKLGYQSISLPGKPLLALRESYASGGKSSNADIKTFDPIYGSRDQYYGRMNIISWSNIDDREIMLTLFPRPNMKVEMNYHWFYIPAPEGSTLLGTLKLKPGAHHLGNEFDIFMSYQLYKHLQLVSVFGYFMPREVQPIHNQEARNATWFALQMLYDIKY